METDWAYGPDMGGGRWGVDGVRLMGADGGTDGVATYEAGAEIAREARM